MIDIVSGLMIPSVDKVPIWEKTTLTIKEAAEYSNIGINRIDEMLKDPACRFVLYVGAKKLVKRKDVCCIIKIPKVAKQKWRKLHLHFGECCNFTKTD